MIDISKWSTSGWEAAVRGMRNPLNSWDKSDSIWPSDEWPLYSEENVYTFNKDVGGMLGETDLKLMNRLALAGSDHAKYRRMITVYVDILAPLYWWKEMDTYKVGTVANSCSTMHTITDKPFELDDFSTDHLFDALGCKDPDIIWNLKVLINDVPVLESPKGFIVITCDVLNHYRDLYLKTKDKKYWWQIIQLLPSSYNQKRTLMLNYENLARIYAARKDHKLDEWRVFCEWIEKLPYAKEIVFPRKEEE